MRNEIRRQTGIIIGRAGEFLIGTVMYSTDLRWSTSPYDAWRTRNRDDARRVAKITGGELWLFNPIARQIRKLND